MNDTTSIGNLTPEEFVIRSIEKLRQPPFKGIHYLYSFFSAAFKEYFPHLDPMEIIHKMADEVKIIVRPTKGGAMLYKPEEIAHEITCVAEALEKVMEEPSSGTIHF